jgi:amino acid permease
MRTNSCDRILGVVINCGGGPDSGYIGGKYWADPGAFNDGFKGFCNILVTAAFSFAGTELIGLAAAETHNPSKSLPSAIKQVFWRIAIVSSLSWVTAPDTNSLFSFTSSPSQSLVSSSHTPAPN